MTGEGGQLDPIERAGSIVDRGHDVTSWDAHSSFGRPGLFARRLLMRALRPYAVRQREVDRALFQAIRAASARRVDAPSQRVELVPAGDWPLEHAAALPEDTVELETDLGDLYFDSRDTNLTELVRRDGRWEVDVAEFIRRRLAPGMTLVDVGAHVGYFSLLASGIVGSAGRVFAIEAEPRNVSLLQANLWRNGCDNVTVLPVAAYDRRGHIRFVSNPDGLAGSSIDAEEGTAVKMVPCARLDDLLGATAVNMIKIDVERVEPQVVRGAETLIRATPMLDIVTEFWPKHPPYGGGGPAEVLGYYESLGLQLRLLSPDGNTEPATPAEVLERGEVSPVMSIVLQKG
jgi:FkbM family methyltransferase